MKTRPTHIEVYARVSGKFAFVVLDANRRHLHWSPFRYGTYAAAEKAGKKMLGELVESGREF